MASQRSVAEYEVTQTLRTEAGVPQIDERQGLADTLQASLADMEAHACIVRTKAMLADIEALNRTVLDWG